MPTANVLTRLKINEVSSVNRGAGEGVRVVFSKSFGDTFEVENLVAKAMDAPDQIVVGDNWGKFREAHKLNYDQLGEVQKRFGAVMEYRKSLPDKTLKIDTAGDVLNAVHMVKHTQDPAAARAFVITRAKALDASNLVPEAWGKNRGWIAKTVDALKGVLKAIDFDEAQEAVEAGEYARGMMDEIMEGVCALQTSVASIMCDEAIVDKQPQLDKTFQQFKDHMQGVVPEWMEKSQTAAATAAALAKGVPMTTATITAEALTKLQADFAKMTTDLAASTALTQKQADQIAFLSMPVAAQEYAKQMKLEGADLSAFVKLDDKAKEDEMKKKPFGKALIDSLPAEVRKSIEEGAAAAARLKKMDEEKDEKDAEDKKKALTLPDTVVVKDLAKSFRDPAVVALLKHVETLNTQVQAGGLFKNFGSKQNGAIGATAWDQLMAKADVALAADPTLKTREKAFTKVYEDRANADLVQQHKIESGRPSAAA